MASFLNHEKPLLTAMIQYPTPEECIQKIQASLVDGAEAFGIQLCKLKKEYRTKETLERIFQACQGLPIYITSYRGGQSAGCTDEECAELLLLGLDAGATLCDIMGDMFDKGAQYELTENPEAVAKQKALIDEIHRRGGEVLMSCHTRSDLSLEENLKIAKAQAERGADIIKIVNDIKDKSRLPVSIQSIQQILEETGKKLLFLVSGAGQIMRYIGPNFGVCMYLCVQHYGPLDTKVQPLLKDLKQIRDHMPF